MSDDGEHYLIAGRPTDEGVIVKCCCGWWSEPAPTEAAFVTMWQAHAG